MNHHSQLLMMIFIFPGLLSTYSLLSIDDCPHSCGNTKIPYPFGTRQGCYLDSRFLVTCNDTTGTPTLGLGPIIVRNISLDGQMTVPSLVSRHCYNSSGYVTSGSDLGLGLGSFRVSSSRNKLIAIGCDTWGVLQAKRNGFYTGCLSVCGGIDSVANGSCAGKGCCQTSIPKGVNNFIINVSRYSNNSWGFNPCSYAFIAADDAYNFSTLDLAGLPDPDPDLVSYRLNTVQELPMIIDWAILNGTCMEATKKAILACKENSDCQDSDNSHGYRCLCKAGYSGNPYIRNGCRDIDECSNEDSNHCMSQQNCRNNEGNYTCFCPKGYHGDGKSQNFGQGCTADRLSTAAIIAVSIMPCLGLIAIIFCACWCVQRRKAGSRRRDLFEKNGGEMLQQLLSKMDRSEEKAEIFTEEQLRKATNNFSSSKIVGEGGYGTVYEGTLGDKLVAIKKSKVVDHGQTEQFINEVIVLSQIKHPNVVKLLGCCLETPVPILVYEFITNNTLHYHIHDEGHAQPLRWHTRLRIAAETASALAHMHRDDVHIIHRDIKSANILLDDNWKAKVSDFGTSRLVPSDQTQLSTLVRGTIGYLDPEYMQSGKFTDKSDVYSFGVVLLELLSGKKVVDFNRPEKDRSLVTLFASARRVDGSMQILDARVRYEGEAEQLDQVANLAMRCLRLAGEERPKMMEVEKELKELLDATDDFPDASYNSMVHSGESRPSATQHFDTTGSSSVTAVLQLSDMSLGR